LSEMEATPPPTPHGTGGVCRVLQEEQEQEESASCFIVSQ